jgi:hypothetical protein
LSAAGREDDLQLPADEDYGPLAEAALRMGLDPERLWGMLKQTHSTADLPFLVEILRDLPSYSCGRDKGNVNGLWMPNEVDPVFSQSMI